MSAVWRYWAGCRSYLGNSSLGAHSLPSLDLELLQERRAGWLGPASRVPERPRLPGPRPCALGGGDFRAGAGGAGGGGGPASASRQPQSWRPGGSDAHRAQHPVQRGRSGAA